MKKTVRIALFTLLFILPAASGFAQQAAAPAGSPVAKYGRLQVKAGKICDERGAPVILRGMSTMGLQWYGDIVNPQAFKALAADWKADVVRLALYVGENGYASRPALKDLVKKGVALAAANGLYVIIDWHVLNPGNPDDPVYAGAGAFFREMAAEFGKMPNVIYEIMNEPNGTLDWVRDLRPCAQKMAALIRAVDPDNLILIGSGTWSQDVDQAAIDPVPGTNLAYTVHFYSGTHGAKLREKIDKALAYGAALFCSEWGTSESSGTGGPYLEKAGEWLAFLEQRGIGWVNWSLCNKNETSAALKSQLREFVAGKGTVVTQEAAPLVPRTAGRDGFPVWDAAELTASGAWVRARLRNDPVPTASRDGAATAPREAEPGKFQGLPWTFEDGTRLGWSVTDDSPARVKLVIGTAETKALGFAYGWTRPSPADLWSVAPRITSSFVNLPAKPYRTFSCDVYLEAGRAKTGSLRIQAVIQSPEHGYWFQLDPAPLPAGGGTAVGNGLEKYSVRVTLESGGKPLAPGAVIRNLILIPLGVDTDYNGMIYFDNITFK